MANIKGGDKLEKALQAIAAALGKNKVVLRVGFLEDAKYPNGVQVALVAAVHNWGAPSRGIPPRPFFTNAVEDNKSGWPNALRVLLKQENYNIHRALALMGEGIKGQIQQSIRDTNSPPLSSRTIRRKGFAKPLIATGHMLKSVSYEIKT